MLSHHKSLVFSSGLQKLAAAGGAPAKTLLQEIGHKGALGAAGAAGALILAATAKPLEERIARAFKPKPSVMGSIFGRGGPFHTALGYGAAGAALGGGAMLANKAFTMAHEPREKRNAFAVMMAEHPHLKHEDPKTVTRSFNTLWHFNQDVAKDPTTAASFVRRAAMFKDEGIQANDVKTLTDIRKALSDARKNENGGVKSHAEYLYKFNKGTEG